MQSQNFDQKKKKVGFVADSVIIQTLKNNNVFIVERSVEMGLQDTIF
jgi:hypothetical protein